MKKDSFRDYILDQLQELEDLRCRPMFGGFGLYYHDQFFGILSDNRLYFKTDSTSVSLYLDRGMEPFKPSPKQTLKSYYEVPAEIIEDSIELVSWAQKSAACQLIKNN